MFLLSIWYFFIIPPPPPPQCYYLNPTKKNIRGISVFHRTRFFTKIKCENTKVYSTNLTFGINPTNVCSLLYRPKRKKKHQNIQNFAEILSPGIRVFFFDINPTNFLPYDIKIFTLIP